MDLGSLLGQVKNAIFQDPSTPHREGFDPTGLIGQIEGLFSQAGQQGGEYNQNVRPASQDPMGDPATQGYGNIRSAREDPLGDPANQ